MKTLNAIVTMMALLLAGQIALAAQGPQEYLQSMDRKLKPLLANADQNQARIIGILNQMMDFDTLCRDSLGKHWDTRTEAERAEFSATLKALIEKNVVTRLKNTSGNNIEYRSETVKGTTATVITAVRDGDGPRAAEYEIGYRMKKNGAGWVVVDMTTDGVSLVSNYRSQFNSIIEKDGWDAMMKKMKEKLAE